MARKKEERRLISESELEKLLVEAANVGASRRRPFALGVHFDRNNIVEIAKSQFPRLEAEVAMHEAEQQTALLRLKELERTKRFLIGVAAFCLMAGATLVVFAPAGKEGISYVIAAILAILPLGAIGVQEFQIRTIGVKIDAGRKTGEA